MDEQKTKIHKDLSITERHSNQIQHQQSRQRDEIQILSSYKCLMQDFSYAKIDLSQIPIQKLQQHKITLLENNDQPFSKIRFLPNNKDFVFSVLHTQFYGLQYFYEIIISNFSLKISVLNLQRQSDRGQDDIDSKQLGAGSFGEVRVLIVDDKRYAVKRIPFHYKLQPEQGYDYQVSKDQQIKLKNALKEYCYFKIFSLLDIGPKIVKSKYDLICFNNCIEFKMQLCQPFLSKIANKQQQFDFQQYKKQLYQKLFRLHSINFVHRDIKPDNILYNPNQNCFVLGDFGFVAYLKQNLVQKTQTIFVGTPNYCGEQMSKLLNGGAGFVNLYLNDLICLQKTFYYTQQYLFSHNSRISENSLSFNASGSFYQSDDNNFSQNNDSQANPTNQSYIPTRNSVLTLPTAHTLAPPKFASSINHYQAEIIYTICRKYQKSNFIEPEYLIELIKQKQKQHKNKEITENLISQLQFAFNLLDQECRVIQFIKEWKNSSRHFGPQSKLTLLKLDKLIEISDENQRKLLIEIKSKFKNFQSSIKTNRIQIIAMRSIRNIQMFQIQYQAYLAHLLKQLKKKQLKNDEIIFAAQHFLYALRLYLPSIQAANQINKMMIIIYLRSGIGISINENSSIVQTSQLTLQFLRSKGKYQIADSLYFLFIKKQSTNWQNLDLWNQAIQYIKRQIKILLQKVHELNDEQKIITIQLLLKIGKQHKIVSKEEVNLNQYFQIAGLFVQSQIKQKQYLKRSLLILLIQKVIILYESSKYEEALKQCQNILDMIGKQNKQTNTYWRETVILYDRMAIIYIKLKMYNLSLNFSQKAFQILEKQVGFLSIPQVTFKILNNKLKVYQQAKKLKEYDQSLQEIADFLQKVTNYNQKYRKLTYIRQLQMKRIQQIGIDNDQRKDKASQLVKNILDGFYLYITMESGNYTILKNLTTRNLLINIYMTTEKDKMFILAKVVQFIQKNRCYRQLFQQQYSNSNFQLAIYTKFTLKRNYDSIKYIWNSLKYKLQKCHPSQLKERQYKKSMLYADCLIRANSNRVAIKFLYCIVKYIPEPFKEIKYKALKLMHKATNKIQNNKQNLFYQITKKNCKMLRNSCFMILPQKLSKQPRFRVLELKYLKKICLAQTEQFQ